MEAFNILKFWRNASPDAVAAAAVSEIDDLDYVRNPVIDTDEETDDENEDSFFDLVFTGPDGPPKLDSSSKSVSIEPESPRDVFFKPNTKPQSPISILRSAPKFRVFFLGFKKSKPEKASGEESANAQSKRFVPASPVFKRDNSLRSKLEKDKEEEFSKGDTPKYLKLMKPLYARASKRYTDKISVSTATSPFSSPSVSSPRKIEEKQGNRVVAFGAMRKHLGKSRSSVTGVSSSPMNRRDDSLMEQNDGIQGAILHCKRSYSLAAKECLTRCASEDLARASTEELNRWSI